MILHVAGAGRTQPAARSTNTYGAANLTARLPVLNPHVLVVLSFQNSSSDS